MLKNLWIDNFRALQHLQLSELGLVNVIVGRNNCGKTALLEALLMASQPATVGGVLQRINEARGYRPAPGSSELWETLFNARDTSTPVHMEFETVADRIILELRPVTGEKKNVSGNGDVIETRPSRGVIGVGLDVVYNDKKLLSGWRVPRRTPREGKPGSTLPSPFGPVIYIPARGTADPSGEALRFSRAVQENEEARLLRLLRLIEPDLQQLRVLASGRVSELYSETTGRGRLPLSLAGDGMSRILSIFTAAVGARGGMLLLDEVENGLHYKIQPKLWFGLAEAARDFRLQVFATTHSDECLRAMLAGIDDARLREHLCIYRIDPARRGTGAVRYTGDELQIAVESAQEVR